MNNKSTGRLEKAREPAGSRFPTTSWTLLEAVRDGGVQASSALAEFVRRYHRPTYAYITAIVNDRAEAEDLTQEFFARTVLSGRLLGRVDRTQGSLRPYLKQALRNFIVDWRRRSVRQPQINVEPDADPAGWHRLGWAEGPGPDAAFHSAWVRALLAEALGRVRAICEAKDQHQHLELFLGRYLSASPEVPSWHELGSAFGLDQKTARNRAETVTRHFRHVIREMLTEETGSDRAAEEEISILHALF